MIDDPIVEAVRSTRRRLLAECAGSLDVWLDRLEAAEASHPDRVVTLEQLRARRQHPAPAADAA
jgi:hypothetical protein